ncbi:formate dehydrogenase subunit gamma [Bacillus massiliigorillae]|uniref:formate dehydrogenase subunit gamma n=1 Tax=Bacillus massiliigorillae TaxID=1243664 RepID=UPI0003A8DA9F|nr:cytochrome b/b6 domain-containing protein [Bacillus massiliigorillae]
MRNQQKTMLMKHAPQTRIMHFIVMIAFVVMLISGIGMYFHLGWLNALFGGPALASLIHRIMGVVFTVVPLLYILTNWNRFAQFIDTIFTFTKDDAKWFTVMGGYLPFLLKGKVPPQDKYNAGQKILGISIVFGSVIFILTGFPMWFFVESMSAAFINLLYLIHAIDALVLGIFVFGHFFLAAIYPLSRKELGTMMKDGLVDEEYSSHHNGKWYREVKNQNNQA